MRERRWEGEAGGVEREAVERGARLAAVGLVEGERTCQGTEEELAREDEKDEIDDDESGMMRS